MTGFKTLRVSNSSTEAPGFEALPGVHHLNQAIASLKESINNGERGCSVKKAGAYLAYRLISYSCLPLALNLVSAIVCGVLALISLPLRYCEGSISINRWLWTRFQGSLRYTALSLFDLTCDLRQLGRLGCCPPESTFVAI